MAAVELFRVTATAKDGRSESVDVYAGSRWAAIKIAKRSAPADWPKPLTFSAALLDEQAKTVTPLD
jgi:hypothetical protein